MATPVGYPTALLFGKTAGGDFVPILVDADGSLITDGGDLTNPFDQDLNTTDTPNFAGLGIGTAGVADQLGVGDVDGQPITRILSTGEYQQGYITAGSQPLVRVEASAEEVKSSWNDATNPNENYVSLSLTPYDEFGTNATVFYLQRSAKQNAILSLYSVGDDTGSALLDIFNPIPGSEETTNFEVNQTGSLLSLDLKTSDGDATVFGFFNITNGAVTARTPLYNAGLFQTSVTDGSNAYPTLVTKLNTAQTANLFEAQAANGDVLAAISAAGSVTAASYTASALPASDAGLSAGQFYQTAGVVMVKL